MKISCLPAENVDETLGLSSHWSVVGDSPHSLHIRADLHGTTLSYGTSLRQAYDMTRDHLHAHNIFHYTTFKNRMLFHSREIFLPCKTPLSSRTIMFSQTTVVKKKMYYNMRVKTLQRNKADLLFRLETEKAVLQADPKNRMHKLFSAIKDVSINANFNDLY